MLPGNPVLYEIALCLLKLSIINIMAIQLYFMDKSLIDQITDHHAMPLPEVVKIFLEL
jgi:hypothetical protein